jgi:hypothetical protein
VSPFVPASMDRINVNAAKDLGIAMPPALFAHRRCDRMSLLLRLVQFGCFWHIPTEIDVRYLVVVARVVLRGHAFFKSRYASRIKSGTGFFAVMRYCTITVVPTATRSYRSLISSLVRRKQPDDTAWPMLSGSFEPWMR